MRKLLFALSILFASCSKPEIAAKAPILTVTRISVDSVLIVIQGSEIVVELQKGDTLYWFRHDGNTFDIIIDLATGKAKFLGETINIQ